MNYFIVISLWAFFGWQHSYLARPFFKERIKKYLGISFEKYWLNSYHQRVYKSLKKFMNKFELTQLKQACSNI